MKYELAKSSGFCKGVQIAVDLAYKNPGIKTTGNLIHNKQVLSDLNKIGVESLKNNEDIHDKSILIRAHGISPKKEEFYNKNALNVIDATCFYVKKIHKIVHNAVLNNYSVIILGDKNHPETIGTFGWSNNTAIIIDNLSEKDKECIDNLRFDEMSIDLQKIYNDKNNYILVSQTTMDYDKTKIISSYLLKLKNNIKIFDTVCSVTKKRQHEIANLAAKNNYVLIIGDRSSSNTNKLYSISKEINNNSYLVENINDLKKISFNNTLTCGIIAGASTCRKDIEDICSYIEKL